MEKMDNATTTAEMVIVVKVTMAYAVMVMFGVCCVKPGKMN